MTATLHYAARFCKREKHIFIGSEVMRYGFEPRRLRIVQRSSSHDVNGKNAALMAREQIIDKIANNRVRLVAQLRHDATNQSAAAAVPFQINCSVNIARAMDLGPTMRTSGLFRPDFDEPKFSLQLRIVHYLGAQ